MKPFVFALLLLLPVAMAGMSPDMENIFREMVDSDDHQGGDDHHDDKKDDDDQGGMSWDMDKMLKMMIKMGEHDSDERDDDDDDDKDKHDWEKKGRSWYDDKKDGWQGDDGRDDSGDDDDKDKHGWEKDGRSWYDDKKDGWQGDDDDDDSREKDDEREKYEKFKKWMEEQRKEEKQDKKEEEMRKKIMAFKKYQHMKQDKQREMEEHKMALYKQMKMIQEKQMMSQHLYEVSKDLMKKKQYFVHEIMTRFLDFCDCDDDMELIKRIKEGRFGFEDDDDMRGGGMGNGGGQHGGNHSSGHDDHRRDMEGFKKPSQEEMHAFVMRFLYMSHEDRVKHVVHDAVRVMCGAAKQFFYYMRQVEHYLREYRRYHHGMNH